MMKNLSHACIAFFVLTLTLQSCKKDPVDGDTPLEGGHHNALNGWEYAGKTRNPTVWDDNLMIYHLYHAATTEGKNEVIFGAQDPSGARGLYRWIVSGENGYDSLRQLDFSIYSAFDESDIKKLVFHTTSLQENGIKAFSSVELNNLKYRYQYWQVKYGYGNTEELISLSEMLVPGNAFSLAPDNAFFSGIALTQPLESGLSYAIYDSQTGNPLSGMVLSGGSMVYLSHKQDYMYVSKSMPGLIQLTWPSHPYPVYPSVVKHGMHISDIAGGSEVSNSVWQKSGDKLLTLIGFDNQEMRLVEVDKNQCVIKVREEYQYPSQALQETWLGLVEGSAGSLLTKANASTSGLELHLYEGNGNGNNISLPDFKPFNGTQVLFPFLNGNKIYLFIHNDGEIFLYTKTL